MDIHEYQDRIEHLQYEESLLSKNLIKANKLFNELKTEISEINMKLDANIIGDHKKASAISKIRFTKKAATEACEEIENIKENKHKIRIEWQTLKREQKQLQKEISINKSKDSVRLKLKRLLQYLKENENSSYEHFINEISPQVEAELQD